ncbi:hypothetical protein J2Y03_000155 [Neobacillus niacini]|nr:hypothetical protein [Neobacillus niacini]
MKEYTEKSRSDRLATYELDRSERDKENTKKR